MTGVGSSTSDGEGNGSIGITLDMTGAGASTVSAAGSADILFNLTGAGAAIASGDGSQQIDFGMAGEGAEVAATIASASGSISVAFGMTGATPTTSRSDHGKGPKRAKRGQISYDEEEEMLEIVGMALPVLQGMLWAR
jgi:hypothetical protein